MNCPCLRHSSEIGDQILSNLIETVRLTCSSGMNRTLFAWCIALHGIDVAPSKKSFPSRREQNVSKHFPRHAGRVDGCGTKET